MRTSEEILVSRVVYRKILKMVEHYKKQDEQDKLEHPDRIPTSWGSALTFSLERILRENKVRNAKDLVPRILNNLVKTKHLIMVYGDYGFSED